jgi:branched-subunit amino acid transport protein
MREAKWAQLFIMGGSFFIVSRWSFLEAKKSLEISAFLINILKFISMSKIID